MPVPLSTRIKAFARGHYPFLLYMLSLFILSFAIFRLRDLVYSVEYAKIVVILAHLLFALFLPAVAFAAYKWIRRNRGFFSIAEAAIFSAYLAAFIILVFSSREFIYGRVLVLDMLLVRSFDVFHYAAARTFAGVLPGMLSLLFGAGLTPFTIILINKVYAVLLLCCLYLIARLMTGNRIIHFLLMLSFALHQHIRLHFNSFENSVGTAFYVYASFLFYILFIREKGKKGVIFYLASCISLTLACIYRPELGLIMGLPFLFFSSFAVPAKKRCIKAEIALALVLLFLFLPVQMRIMGNEDPFLIGRTNEQKGALSVLDNFRHIIINNIARTHDLSLANGNISLFIYSGTISSLLLIGLSAYRAYRKKGLGKGLGREHFYGLSAAYFLIFITLNLAYHIDGMRGSPKYAILYYFSAIAVTYSATVILAERIRKWRRMSRGAPEAILFFIVVATAFASSPSISFSDDYMVEEDIRGGEMKAFYGMRESLKGCRILKASYLQPLIDHYAGLQSNALILGKPPEYYANLKAVIRKGECYYYYHERVDIFSEILGQDPVMFGWYERFYVIEQEKVDSAFAECNRTIVRNFQYRSIWAGTPELDTKVSYNNTLIRYSC